MARQRALLGGAMLAFVLIMAQLHLAMHRIQDVDDAVDMKLAALDKRLRQKAVAGRLSTSALIDELLSRNGGGAGGNATPAVGPPAIAAAEANMLGGVLDDLRGHHVAMFQADLERLELATRDRIRSALAGAAVTAGAGAVPVAVSKGVPERTAAGLMTGEKPGPLAPVKAGTVLIAPIEPGLPFAAVKKIQEQAEPGCNGIGEGEPRMQWEGDWVDFGPPASDSLVRMHVGEEAVAAGLQYTKWDKWQWKQQCGSKWTRVGSRTSPGADRSNIKYVRVWGERNSCTTMVTDLLSRNLDLTCDGTASCVSGGLPNKHDFMRGANLHDQAETLNILVSRHPYEWLSSMRRHPFYAGLHYDKPMEEFLTQEWASFRLRDLGDAHNKLSAASVRNNGNITVHWGRAHTIGACSSAGKLSQMEQCYTTQDAAGSLRAVMRCTRIPGLAPVMFKNDADAGAGMLGAAAETCMNATASLRHCHDHSFLCQTGTVQQWELSGWRPHLEAALHTRAHMDTLGGVLERKGVSCYRKIGGTVVKIADDFCAPKNDLKGEHFAKTDLYECQKVPDYEVGQGYELAPSPTCLSAGYAWGVCEEGRFLCRILSEQLWHKNKQLWQQALGSIKAANNHFQQTFGSDTEPSMARRFPSIAALRTAKLRDWFRVSHNMSFSTHLACRDFYLEPRKYLDTIKSDFGLKLKKQLGDKWNLDGCIMEFGNCDEGSAKNWESPKQAKKRQTYLSGKHVSDFDKTSLSIANAWLDGDLEAHLGYALFPTVPEAARPYDQTSRCTHHVPPKVRNNMCSAS